MYTMQLEITDANMPLTTARGMSIAEFEAFCFANPELVIEREADGTLTIMSPVSPVSGRRESIINADLVIYARQYGGAVFSSSTGFQLPDGSVRSPDACYVTQSKLAGFSDEELRHFAELVPDFVVEILSPTDRLEDAQRKMRESWIANGVQLAWLIDVDGDKLWIYRADHTVEIVTPLDQLIGGEDVLPDFQFNLSLLL